MNMKKVLFVLLAIIAILGLVACESKNENELIPPTGAEDTRVPSEEVNDLPKLLPNLIVDNLK